LRSTGFDGNLIVFLVTCIFGMNWLSMDIMREQSLGMYFNKVPVINYDAVRMFFGFFGQVQGAVAMIMLGLFVLPNCQSELEGVSCVKGDTAPQEVLIIIAATQFGFTVQILTWLLGGNAKKMNFNTMMMWPWVPIQLILGVLACLAATDATAISDDKVIFYIIVIAMTSLSVIKTAMFKVTDSSIETSKAEPVMADP
jgi:hypothetical protein